MVLGPRWTPPVPQRVLGPLWTLPGPRRLEGNIGEWNIAGRLIEPMLTGRQQFWARPFPLPSLPRETPAYLFVFSPVYRPLHPLPPSTLCQWLGFLRFPRKEERGVTPRSDLFDLIDRSCVTSNEVRSVGSLSAM